MLHGSLPRWRWSVWIIGFTHGWQRQGNISKEKDFTQARQSAVGLVLGHEAQSMCQGVFLAKCHYTKAVLLKVPCNKKKTRLRLAASTKHSWPALTLYTPLHTHTLGYIYVSKPIYYIVCISNTLIVLQFYLKMAAMCLSHCLNTFIALSVMFALSMPHVTHELLSNSVSQCCM